jgi:hypothetical protein
VTVCDAENEPVRLAAATASGPKARRWVLIMNLHDAATMAEPEDVWVPDDHESNRTAHDPGHLDRAAPGSPTVSSAGTTFPLLTPDLPGRSLAPWADPAGTSRSAGRSHG